VKLERWFCRRRFQKRWNAGEPQNLAYGGDKISGDRPHSERVFAGRSGGTTTCKHSQELTPWLLELKATSWFPRGVGGVDLEPKLFEILSQVRRCAQNLSIITQKLQIIEKGLKKLKTKNVRICWNPGLHIIIARMTTYGVPIVCMYFDVRCQI